MKIIFSLILILDMVSVAHIANATTTLGGVSGASNYVAASATETSAIVYGGIQGDNASNIATCTTSGTCNTCTGTVSEGACNPAGVFADTIVTFAGATSVTTNGHKWLLCNAATEIDSSINYSTNLSTTWGEICNGITAGNTSCTTALNSGTVYLGVGPDCSNLGTEKVALKFVTRRIDPTATGNVYTDCPPNVNNTSFGACYFSLFPGDGKAYIESDFGVASTFPAVDSAPGVTYTNIVFLFAEGAAGDDQNTYNSINNEVNGASGKTAEFIPVTDADSLGGSFIDGLNNDARVCFKMASQDTAKNIELYSPATLCASGTCDNVCVTPSEVVGVLSDKKCFIATAAYGSEMDQHVQTLRNFRNQFMAPFWIGRKLVKAYYSVSPKLASWISQHESARTLARGVLWPVLGWSELALKYGWSVVLMPFFFLAALFFTLRKRRIKRG